LGKEGVIMIKEIKKDLLLTELKKKVKQKNINLYAEVTGMTDPIHTNIEIAKDTVFKTTIIHGATLLDYMSHVMYESFGIDWLINGEINAKIIAPVKKGEEVTTKGSIKNVEEKPDGMKKVETIMECYNSKGIVAFAKTEVTINN
jgi:acyl dehydratase